MNKISIIIPVHNRRDVTIRCLKQLGRLHHTKGWEICVVDDGSTDGTSVAIAELFPDVIVLKGSGELYWTGSVELGMREAINRGAKCCVWVNDDLVVDPDMVEKLARFSLDNQVLASGQGAIARSSNNDWKFPVLRKGKKSILVDDLPNNIDGPFCVDTCRGNLVAVPRSVVMKIGYPDGVNCPHVGGDTDYGLRATKNGGSAIICPDVLFYEKETLRNDNRSWLLSDIPIRKIWKSALSKRGNLYPRMLFVYNIRHWGWRLGGWNVLRAYFKIFAISTIKALVPKVILIKFYGSRSRAHRDYIEDPK